MIFHRFFKVNTLKNNMFSHVLKGRKTRSPALLPKVGLERGSDLDPSFHDTLSRFLTPRPVQLVIYAAWCGESSFAVFITNDLCSPLVVVIKGKPHVSKQLHLPFFRYRRRTKEFPPKVFGYNSLPQRRRGTRIGGNGSCKPPGAP